MAKPTLHDDPERTTPIGLARYSVEFFEAALAADDKLGKKGGHEMVAPVPVMFLIGQALELSLKAYLLSKGVDLRKLRHDYGHGLHRALRKAKEFGLASVVTLTNDEEEVIELLDALYSTKQLQYIVTGAKTFPLFGPLQRVADKLVYGIAPAVGYTPRNR